MTALLSAGVSALVAVVVVVMRERLVQKQLARDSRAGRLAEFSAAAWAVALFLGQIAAEEGEGQDGLADAMDGQVADRFNSALAMIRLLDAESVYTAAIAVDESLNRLLEAARGDRWTRSAWKAKRDTTLAPALESFEMTARSELSSPSVPHIPWTFHKL